MPDTGHCSTCRWWDTSTSSSYNEEYEGACRRRAPFHDDRTALAVWPFTTPDDWCAEYQGEPVVYCGLVGKRDV